MGAEKRLRQEYHLPTSWNLQAMLTYGSSKLLQKTDASNELRPIIQQLIDATQVSQISRDRRDGSAPGRFKVHRVVSVANAENWRGYAERREEVRQLCRSSAVCLPSDVVPPKTAALASVLLEAWDLE